METCIAILQQELGYSFHVIIWHCLFELLQKLVTILVGILAEIDKHQLTKFN